MTFIGRASELKFLKDRYTSDRAQLVVLYGRRRVGKTEALVEFARDLPHVFFAAASATKDEQLASFSRLMFQAGSPAARYLDRYMDWESALRDIANLPRQGGARRLVVIDEFPYLVASDPSLPSVLQNLWDHELRHTDVMIVLCGSAMGFIEKEILSEKAPLYGRATGILKMEPMPYWDAAQFTPDWPARDRVLAYAALGGIPHYLAQLDPKMGFAQNMRSAVLTRGMPLYSETEFLMRQEFRETATYNALIQAVALGATQLNEIAQKTMMTAQKAATYLANLIKVGILEREFPVTAPAGEAAKGMRGLYQVADDYFRFWYSFVFPNLSPLEMGDMDGVWEHEVAPRLNDYAATPFERICAAWIRRENLRGHLPFHASHIGRWWNKTDEIDVVATDHGTNHVILGECKFHDSPADTHMPRALQAKGTQPPFRDADQRHWIFSATGFDPTLATLAQADPNLRLIGPDELYED